jgi:hypothetical protein
VAKQQRQVKDLPERVLSRVYWSFRGGAFADRATFNEQVRQYQIDIAGEDTWSPDEIVIPCPQIRVVYVYWQGEEQLDGMVQLTSDDGKHCQPGKYSSNSTMPLWNPYREITIASLKGSSCTHAR